MKKISFYLLIPAIFFGLILNQKFYAQEKNQVYNVTETEIIKFIKFFPELKNTIENSSDDENIIMMSIQKTPITKLNMLAVKNGFKDHADLLRVCGGAILGYAMIKMKEAEEQMNQELNSLTPEMKAMIKPQLDAIKLQLKKYEKQVSNETINAVKKHYEEMNKLFESTPVEKED
ncbi:MAG TPA: hypothetical protein P5105_04985 [Victivallales bacterium]|nr:hypothetical protein [Victivallales bacterium]HRR06618.1 hypothetical protein [Victivallales bacterium]HRU01438.1 hypothetical protein [Victivallales bacterium]